MGEAALVAGVIRGPVVYSPWANFEAARRRSFVVLQRMREEGKITSSRNRPRVSSGCGFCRSRQSTSARHGYAKELLRQQFREIYGGDHPPDWKVRTTFVPAIQDAAELRGSRRTAPARHTGATGGARGDRPGDGQPARHGWRVRLCDHPVQSRRSQQAPAGLCVQAVRVRDGARTRMSPASTVTGLLQVAVHAPEGVWIPRDERASSRRRH